MGCCNVPMHYFDCGPSREDRIANDIKKCSELIPFNLEQFTDFFWKNPDYAIEGFPGYIKGPKGTEFNAILRTSVSSARCFLLNGKTGEYEASWSYLVKPLVDDFFDSLEKDRMRDRLRSVGINPEW